jgi:hypothetical protein
MSVYARISEPGSKFFTAIQHGAANLRIERDRVFALIMLGALTAFELFNFSTTEFALTDLLGDLQIGFMRWATILALAFSSMDFAGVAWLFSPKRRVKVEVWYLVAAWLLAATMNAVLTWWSVSLALLNHQALGNEVIAREALLNGAPVFVAILVWLLRVLLIGSFTLAGRRRQGQPLGQPAKKTTSNGRKRTLVAQPISQR